jgi:2-dehydro-3-deoxyphosphooctonate aldolase (KDO 8-P synthase)
MSPWNMRNSIKKIESFVNDQILLADRGTFFGYNILVKAMTSLPIKAQT